MTNDMNHQYRDHSSSDMDFDSSSHEQVMAKYKAISYQYNQSTENETINELNDDDIESDTMSVKSTQSESKLILNELKTKLNQQKSVWGNLASKTNKYIDLFLLTDFCFIFIYLLHLLHCNI